MNTLQYAHFETRQTSEKRVAVVTETTHHGIYCQDRILICLILSALPLVTHLNEASLTNIAHTISKGEVASNQIKRFFTTAGCMELPNIVTGM